MLKASSILFALYVCLIVSVLSGALLLIFGYQYQLKQFYFVQEELVDGANANMLALLEQLNSDLESTKGEISSIDERFKTHYRIKNWGGFPLVVAATNFKQDTVYKSALIGGKSTSLRLALYMTERDKSLNIGGGSQIVGDVLVSKRGVSPAYVGNTGFTRKELVKGTVGRSKRELPTFKAFDQDYDADARTVNYEELKQRALTNSFHEPLLIVEVTEQNDIEDLSLSGHILLKSKDSLSIAASTRLNHILIEAPAVTFQAEFKGTVQVFASRNVELGEGTILLYPSSIYLKNDTSEKADVILQKASQLGGAIVATGQGYESSLNKMVTIDEEATLIGDLYCHGKTQLKGKVVGTVYTNLFYLKTPSSVYENYIVGGAINRLDLPKDFVGIPLFDNEKTDYSIVQEL